MVSLNRHKNEIILVPVAINENEFFAFKEIPFNERCFLNREPHSSQRRYDPSLSVADITNTKYVCVQVYLPDSLSNKIKTVVSGKRAQTETRETDQTESETLAGLGASETRRRGWSRAGLDRTVWKS